MKMRLPDAIILAAAYHKLAQDKQGELYILHPLRVMLAVPPEARIVAVLHDAVEDTALTLQDLILLGLGEPHLTALDLVTRPDAEDGPTYAEYIRTICDTPGEAGRIARAVKIADIKDNLDRLAPELYGLQKRYLAALDQLDPIDQ